MDAKRGAVTPEFGLGVALDVAEQLVGLVLAVVVAVAKLGLVNAHAVGAGPLRLGAVPVEVQAADLVRVVAAVILVVALPSAGNAALILAAEVRVLALVNLGVLAFVSLVLTVFAVRFAIANPVQGDAPPTGAFELCV